MKCLAIILICLGSSCCLGSSNECETVAQPLSPEIRAKIQKIEAELAAPLRDIPPAAREELERYLAHAICSPPPIVYEPSLSLAPWVKPNKIIPGCNPVPPSCYPHATVRFK
jgi:hypothetical protein